MPKMLKDIGVSDDDDEVRSVKNDDEDEQPKKRKPIVEVVAPEYEASRLHSGQLEFLTLVRVIVDPELQARLWPRLTEDHFAAETSRSLWSRLHTLQILGRDWPKLATVAIDPALPKAAQSQLLTFVAKAEAGKLATEIDIGNGQKVPVSSASDFEGHVFDILDAYRITRKSMEQIVDVTNKLADEDSFDPLQAPEMFERVATEILNFRGRESVSDSIIHYGVGTTVEDDERRRAEVKKILSTDRLRYKTGLHTYDEKVGGFQPGEVVLLGANSGGGKSSMSLTLMHNMARMGYSVAMLQLELTKSQLNERLSSNLANINSEEVRTGKLTDKQKRAITAANDEFHDECRSAKSRFTVFAPSAATIQECEYVFKTFKYHVWFIDYINLLKWDSGGGGKERSGEDWSRLSDIVKEFKRMAKKYGVTVVLNVQVNIDKETGDISIRYAQAMREHADVVLVWNLDQEARDEGVIWLRHLKARQYEPFDFPVRVALQYCRFESVNMALQPKAEQKKLGSKKKVTTQKEEPEQPTFQKKEKPLVLDESIPTPSTKAPLRLDDEDPYADIDGDE